MYTAKISISPKKSVLDPQGKAVHHALETLGFTEVDDVRIGKFIEIKVDQEDRAIAAEKVNKMCESLLANTVIEDYTFELDPN